MPCMPQLLVIVPFSLEQVIVALGLPGRSPLVSQGGVGGVRHGLENGGEGGGRRGRGRWRQDEESGRNKGHVAGYVLTCVKGVPVACILKYTVGT